jgi:hypothetical protein
VRPASRRRDEGNVVLTPRALVTVSLLLLGVHAVLLMTFGDVPPGPVISSAMQLSIGAVCIVAVVNAALTRGAAAFERRFLWLVAIRYFIWAAAQALATHYERTGNEDFAGSPADVLFHLEDVPLGLAFFLDPGRDGERTSRARAFDLLHVVVFWIAVVCYIRHMTTGADVGVGLVAATNGLVAGCFYLRAMTSRSLMAAALFGRFTPAKLLSTANDGYGGFYASQAGSPFDLVWSLELVVWTITAATWRPARAADPLDPRPSSDRTVHLLPFIVSSFSLVLAAGLAQRQLALAGVIAAGAVGLSAATLLGRRSLQQRSTPTES